MTSPPDALALAVERKLDARVRPLLQIHGGEVTLVSVTTGMFACASNDRVSAAPFAR